MADVRTIEKGTYRHTKSGKLYQVIGTAFHTETEENLVVYKPMYESAFDLFARPLSMFTESIELDGNRVPRFERIEKDKYLL